MRRVGAKRMATRRKRIRRSPWRRIVPTVAVVAICLGLYIVLWTDCFQLREVQLVASGDLPLDSLSVVTAGVIGENLLTLPLSHVRERLLSFPEVKDVTFRRRIFHRLDCYFKRREPVAILSAGSAYEVDEEGVVIPRRAGGCEIDLPVVTGLDERELGTDGGHAKITDALEVLALMKTFGFSPAQQLSEIHIDGEELYLVLMGTGTVIRMGGGGYLEKVRNLRAVYGTLQDQQRFPEMIDLRFDGQVIVRDPEPRG